MPGVIPEATGIAGGGGSVDPFGMINSLMGLKLKMNENQQFQSQYMANQALGEIIAHAPSLEEGLNQAQQNPNVMAFGGTALQTARSIRALQLQGMEIKQKLGQSGYESALQASLQAANDPLNYNRYIDNAKKLVDPEVQDRVTPQLEALRDSIAHKIQGFDLSDPGQANQAKQAITALVAGAAGAAGTDSSHLVPFLRSTGVDEQGIPIQKPSPLEQEQGAVPRVMAPAGQPSSTGPAGGPPVVTNSANGEKYPVDTSGVTPYLVRDASGNPATSIYGRHAVDEKNFGTQNQALKEQHNTTELASYNGDKGMLNSLGQMQAAADDLTAQGGFTVPGLFGTARAAISNAMETFENITGTKFTGDAALPDKNADAQVINKWAHALPFQFRKALEGTNGRGLGVLMEAAAAVPSMENTPLAFKILTSGLKALANWDIGKYEYKEAYMKDPRNSSGTLLGSDLAYNKVSSPLGEATRELAKDGIVLDGSHIRFSDDQHLLGAYERGLFGARKSSPDAPDGPAEKAMDDMYNSMHPEVKK